MTEYAPRRRSLAIGLAFFIALSIGVASTLEATQSRTELGSWTDDQAELAETVVKDVISDVFNDLEAVAAFVEEANPNASSFDRFVDSIEGTANAVGLAYVAIIPSDELDAHLAQVRDELGGFYEVSALTAEGTRSPVDRTGRSVYYPVQLLAVGDFIRPFIQTDIDESEIGLGVDAGYNSDWRRHISDAATANGPTISEFIEVQLDIVVLDRVFFVAVPVNGNDGTIRGLVAAPMLEGLLLRDLDSLVLEDVQWEVFPQGTAPTRIEIHEASIYPLDMGGTIWSLAIAPTAETLAQLQAQPWWVTGLTAGVLSTLASIALWLFVDRRGEHKRVAQFKQAADDKDRFLASVSHELRTPLTVVSGVANELYDRPDGFSAEEQSGLMGMLVEQTDELAGIVEDLLIAARSDIGKVVIHYQEVDLLAEAKRAMDTSGAAATVEGTPATAWADDQRVRQILRNLLSNARRYGGPTIRVEFSSEPGWAEVVVADNGQGVPPAMQQTMFKPYQSSHKPDHGVRSVGLGLYIARNLAQAMNGELDYDFDGAWSRFRLRLPEAMTEHHVSASQPTTV